MAADGAARQVHEVGRAREHVRAAVEHRDLARTGHPASPGQRQHDRLVVARVVPDARHPVPAPRPAARSTSSLPARGSASISQPSAPATRRAGTGAGVGHAAGRLSGSGMSASVTSPSSSWHEAMNARSVRAVAPYASNASMPSPSGSYAFTNSARRRSQRKERGRHRVVDPRPDLHVRGIEAPLPGGRKREDDIPPDELRPVVVVPDRRAQQARPEASRPELAVGPLEHGNTAPRQRVGIDREPVPLDDHPQPVLDAPHHERHHGTHAAACPGPRRRAGAGRVRWHRRRRSPGRR